MCRKCKTEVQRLIEVDTDTETIETNESNQQVPHISSQAHSKANVPHTKKKNDKEKSSCSKFIIICNTHYKGQIAMEKISIRTFTNFMQLYLMQQMCRKNWRQHSVKLKFVQIDLFKKRYLQNLMLQQFGKE